MEKITHLTSASNAIGIIRERMIFGANVGTPNSLEGYPHFYHVTHPPSGKSHLAKIEVQLIFECDFPKVRAGGELPTPGTLNEHWHDLGQRSFWQYTIHPDGPPIQLVGFIMLDSDVSSRDRQLLERGVADRPLIQPVWHPSSAMATKTEPPLAPRPGLLGRLLGRS